MIRFENMQDYTQWVLKEAEKLGKYAMVMIEIKSIGKRLCVCGTPLGIEPMAEKVAEKFIEEWNICMVGDDEQIDTDADLDLISVIRDEIIDALENHKNMEFVYVSTEY